MLKFIAGQQLKEFEAYRRGTEVGGDGRTARLSGASLGKLRAATAEIDPSTDERARQLTHPATHRIIIRGVLGWKSPSLRHKELARNVGV